MDTDDDIEDEGIIGSGESDTGRNSPSPQPQVFGTVDQITFSGVVKTPTMV